MTTVTPCDVPQDSLLAGFGGPADYRDCFVREVSGEVSLADYIERFYSSAVFGPERVVLGLIGRGASMEDIRALARGKSDRLAVWEVIERRSGLVAEHGERPASRKGDRPPAGPEGRGDRSAEALRNTKTQREEILLLSRDTNTASWLSVSSSNAAVGQTTTSSSSEAVGQTKTKTKLHFGSWVGGIEESRWKFMLAPHVWYSRLLLGGV